jgi:hypothetical protein
MKLFGVLLVALGVIGIPIAAMNILERAATGVNPAYLEGYAFTSCLLPLAAIMGGVWLVRRAGKPQRSATHESPSDHDESTS